MEKRRDNPCIKVADYRGARALRGAWRRGLVLVVVIAVSGVAVAVVDVVNVVAVWEGNVAAAFTVGVLVFSVGSVSHSHESFLRFVVGECPSRFHSVFIKSCFQYGFNSAREIFDIFSLGRGGAGCVEVKT